MPISASFFFEREAAGLMFDWHRWPHSLRWWLFCQFPREDTAADYERRHDCPESPKLHLLHCGVLRSLNTTSHCCIRKLLNQALRNSSGSLAKFTAIRLASSFSATRDASYCGKIATGRSSAGSRPGRVPIMRHSIREYGSNRNSDEVYLVTRR
jgi:hypothetical protein